MYTTLSYGHFSYLKKLKFTISIQDNNFTKPYKLHYIWKQTNYIEEDENVFKFKYILYLRYEELFQEP